MKSFCKSVLVLSMFICFEACNDSNENSVCGNGILEEGETCEGTNFSGLTCEFFGYRAGELICSQTCEIELSSCRKSVCGNGIIEDTEQCDSTNMNGNTCESFGFSSGSLICNSQCDFDTSNCISICGNGRKEVDEECDGEDFGGKTCADVNASKPFGRLGCTRDCKIAAIFCGVSDLGLQAPISDAESTDVLCSNGVNDFHTQNKDGSESSWFDCDNNQCTHSPLVQICNATENSDAACSDHVDNAMGSKLHKNFKNRVNGLTDCEDPSCYKNWRITVCSDEAPKWELGADCSDGVDNDGDGLKDCEDPDCLHAGASTCVLNGKKRILFDNAHHEIAGAVDWIIDITGRHPYPSKPAKEDEWHGSLSLFALDLLNTHDYIPETLPQDRRFTWNDAQNVQDLSQYDILVIPEPSSQITPEESKAIYEFVNHGGGLMLVADHEGADRDANGYDSVRAINEMLAAMPDATSKESNPFGFYVLPGAFSNNSTTKVVDGAESGVIAGRAGTIESTGMYGAAGFQIVDTAKVKSLLTEKSSTEPFAVTASVGKGRVVAIGDSAIFGDGTNYLGLSLTSENGYIDANLNNKILFLNSIDWLAKK